MIWSTTPYPRLLAGALLCVAASGVLAEVSPAQQTTTNALFGYNGKSRPDLGCPDANWTPSKDVAAQDCLDCRNLAFDPDCTMDHYTGNIIYGDCNPSNPYNPPTDPINYFVEGYYCTSGTLNEADHTCLDAYVCPNASWTLVGAVCSRADCEEGTYRDQPTGACLPEKSLGEACSE